MSEFEHPDGERKNVTALFADIVDSTVRVDRLDAEDAQQLLSSVVGRLSHVVAEHGGTVIHRLGDGIVAVFGAPVAMEDHAVRACHAALAMQAMMRRLADKTANAAPVMIRIGIHTGEAVVQPNPLDVFGIMVHIASRLQSIAQPGSAWISKATQLAAGRAFECKALGAKSVKNVQQPVEVYALERARGDERPRFGLEDWKIDVQFVGRIPEMEVIKSAFTGLTGGRGCILSLWGDAGIGKSRLLAESRARAGGSLHWLEGYGLSLGRSISYWPLLQIIRRYIGAQEDDENAAVWNKLSAAVHDLFGPDTDDVLPYLATFLGVPVQGELQQRVMYLDGEAMGRQFRRSLRLFFQNMARKRPTFLVFEDFYWADESSAALLEHLLPLAETEAIIFCIIGRGEENSLDSRLRAHAAQDHPSVFVEIALTALGPAEGALLFDRLFQGEPSLARLREKVLANAEGNPLFIEEVIRTLLETRALVRDPDTGKWSLTTSLDTIRIPGTIQDVVTARVDRLDDDVKHVLTAASVIGKTFLYKVLNAVIAQDQQIDADIAALVRQAFIDYRSRTPEIEYTFRHAVIQEVTYDSILKTRRRQIHRQVGEALESLFSTSLDEMSGVLAYHFARAELWDKAQAYLFTAGARADRLAADGEALYSYRQAVEACMHAFGNRIAPLQRATIDRKLGEVYYRRGEHEDAFFNFERALECVGGSNLRRADTVRRSLLREGLVQVFHLCGIVRRTGRSSGEASEHRIAIYMMMTWMFLFDDPERLLLCTLTLLNDAERHDHWFGVTFASGYLAYGCDMLGLHGMARLYCRKAERAAAFSKNPLAESMVALANGWHLTYIGAWDQAADRFANASKLGWACGDVRLYGSALFGQAFLYCQFGRLEAARELAHNSFTVGVETADGVSMRYGMLANGMILLRLGRLEKCEALLRRCFDITQTAHDFLMLSLVAAEFGQCLVQQQKFTEADEVLAIGAEAAVSGRQRGYASVLLKVAQAEALVAKAEHAVERAQPLGAATQACKTALRAVKRFPGARAQALRLLGTCSWLGGDKKAAQRHWREAMTAAEALGLQYEKARINLTIGRLTSDAAILERANAQLQTLTAGVAVEAL